MDTLCPACSPDGQPVEADTTHCGVCGLPVWH
jgi:hypothetical protein